MEILARIANVKNVTCIISTYQLVVLLVLFAGQHVGLLLELLFGVPLAFYGFLHDI
jgi:hypothetical protein